MAGKNPVTRIIITATDQASGVFTTLRNHVGKIATAITAYFGAKLFGAAMDSAMEFEAAMSRVAAASDGGADELKLLRDAAKEAGSTTKYSATEAAGALEEIVKAGVSAKDAVAALPAVLNLAQAGSLELGTAAEYIAKAVNGMGLSFAEAGRVADVLALGANATMTSVEGLAQSLSYAAPLANSLGVSLEETVAILGKFADAGIDASRAGTALNNIFAQFSDPASKFRRELSNMGIVTGNFGEALRKLAAAGPKGERAIQAIGLNAGPAFRALLNQGVGALDELVEKLQNATGSAAQTAAVMNNNLKAAMKGMRNAWGELRDEFVTPLLEPAKEQVEALTERMRNFISSGTGKAFGDALRSAFVTAATHLQEFLNRVDFRKVTTDMRNFTTEAIQLFGRMAETAKTTGATMQLVYGVFAGGVSVVITAWNSALRILYKMQEGVGRLASGVNKALASITFGDASRKFKQFAAEMDQWAEFSASNAEYYAKKSGKAFAGIVRNAEITNNAWEELTKETNDADAAGRNFADGSQRVVAGLSGIQTQAQTTAEKIADLINQQHRLSQIGDVEAVAKIWEQINTLSAEAASGAKEAGAAQRAEAQATAEKLAELTSAYQTAIETGDLQRAAELQQQIAATKAVEQHTSALGGTIQALERQQEINTASAGTELQLLNLKREQARSSAAIAKSLGNERAATWATIEARRVDIQVIQAKARLAVQQAQTSVLAAEQALEEAKANGELTDEKEHALLIAQETLKLKLLEQEASEETIRQIEAEIAATIKLMNVKQGAGGAEKEFGDNAEEAGDKVEQAGKQMGGAGGVAQWMADVMNASADSIRAVSERAGEAADAVRTSAGSFHELVGGMGALAARANEFIREDALGKMERDVAKLEESAEKTAAAASKLKQDSLWFSNLGGFLKSIAAMQELESALYRARAEMAKFDLEVQKYNETFAEGNENLREQERLLTGLVSRAEQLGSEQLDGLRSALEDVRGQLKDMTESAEEALASVRDELDQLNENYAASERRAQEKKLAELREKLREAELAGNNEAITLYRQAIQEQNRLASLRIEEAKAREKTAKEEKAAREKEAAEAKQPAKAAPAAPARQPATQVTTHRVELNFGGRTVATINTDAAGQRGLDAFISELERAASVAQ